MTEAACKYFGDCGGCTYQDVPYSEQLAAKRALLEQQSGITDIKVFSGSPLGYRTRLDMGFHDHGIGFRHKGNWRQVLDISECPIAHTSVNKLISEVRAFFSEVDAFNPRSHRGSFHHALIRATRIDSAVSIVLNKESEALEHAKARVDQYAKVSSAHHVLRTYVGSHSGVNISEDFEVLKGSAEMEEEILGHRFSFSIQGFFQNNSAMAEEMHRYVRQILSRYPTAQSNLLDLYGGVGTFGILNAAGFRHVVMVENFPGCVTSAKSNISQNKIANMEALLLDAKDLKTLALPAPLYAIVDPPRGGMHKKTIKELLRLKPSMIVFVCCNVPQLSLYLSQFEGYVAQSAALFDFFPQTPHCEAVLELLPVHNQ